MAKPYRVLRDKMSAEAQQKAEAKARRLLESPTRPGSSRRPGQASTKCTDALAPEGQDTPLPFPPQEEPLDIGGNVGWCRSCLKRRVLCAFGQCVQCHETDEHRRGRDDTAGHLCCGWYATGTLDAPWSCPTCGRVHG